MITWGVLRRFGWVGAFLVVVGCTASDGAAPTVSPVRPTSVLTSGASGTATASQTSRPDDGWARVPKAARAHTYAGAQAFAEFYISQLNAAWTRPDPAQLAGLADRDCGTCAAYADVATQLAHDHQRYDRQPVVLKSSAWQPESTATMAQVYVVGEQSPAHVVDAGGRTIRTESRSPTISAFSVRWHHAEGWRVSKIRLVVTK
jgi:Family of unknown function (DUF6318)